MTKQRWDNSDQLRAMWVAGASRAEIAAALGITAHQVSYRVYAMGLEKRGRGGPRVALAEDRPENSLHAAPKLPRMMPHPFWTPERDVMVLRTGGRYADIGALARGLGKTHQVVLGRWHALRAAGGRA